MSRVVRVLHRAARVPGLRGPNDTLHARVYFPGRWDRGAAVADADAGPFPVVLFLPDAHVGPESYRWLAHALADRGYAFVTYGLVCESGGEIGLSPGVDLARMRAGHLGHAPPATAIGPLLEMLAHMQREGALAGLLDLEEVVFGGHGVGGTAALHSAALRHFGSVSAAFSYAGHTLAPAALGWPAEAVMPVPGDVPLLLLGGERDGVIAGHGEAFAPIRRTFEEGVTGGRGDAHLFLVAGANHGSLCHPDEAATTSPVRDHRPTAPGESLRGFLLEVISTFLDAYVREDSDVVAQLEQLGGHPLVLQSGRR